MALVSTMFDCTAQVTRPTVGKDSAQGTTSDPFVNVGPLLACSYQEGGEGVLDIYGQRNTVLTSTLYFDREPNTEVNDVIVVTAPRTGETFKVLVEGEVQPVARGRMFSVAVKRIREPKS